jgi:hypothetical protein
MVCHERLRHTCTPFSIFLNLFSFLNNRLLIVKYQHCLLCQPLRFAQYVSNWCIIVQRFVFLYYYLVWSFRSCGMWRCVAGRFPTFRRSVPSMQTVILDLTSVETSKPSTREVSTASRWRTVITLSLGYISGCNPVLYVYITFYISATLIFFINTNHLSCTSQCVCIIRRFALIIEWQSYTSQSAKEHIEICKYIMKMLWVNASVGFNKICKILKYTYVLCVDPVR